MVGWADVFSRKVYRDMILESFDYFRKAKDMNLFSYVIMTNHIHAIELSDNRMIDSRLEYIHQNPVRTDVLKMHMIILTVVPGIIPACRGLLRWP